MLFFFFSEIVKVLVFKSIATFSTSGNFLSCLLIALEHIEHVNPVATISALEICVNELVTDNNTTIAIKNFDKNFELKIDVIKLHYHRICNGINVFNGSC